MFLWKSSCAGEGQNTVEERLLYNKTFIPYALAVVQQILDLNVVNTAEFFINDVTSVADDAKILKLVMIIDHIQLIILNCSTNKAGFPAFVDATYTFII